MIAVARYEGIHEVHVHTGSCGVWSTTPRVAQVEPVVVVPEGWVVRQCDLCRPQFGVVAKERHVVYSRGTEMLRRFEAAEQKRHADLGALDVPWSATVRDGWRREAACRSSDERLAGWMAWLFTADLGRRWQTDVQKLLCGECPVRVDCLLMGVWGEEPWGVWGGSTPLERKLLLARWRREGRAELHEQVVEVRLPRVSGMG